MFEQLLNWGADHQAYIYPAFALSLVGVVAVNVREKRRRADAARRSRAEHERLMGGNVRGPRA